MAPELFKKAEYEGPPVDIFACGCILFLLITGMQPFHYSGDKYHKRLCSKPEKAFVKR
jgi:serine/threonine protein kinase